jgi:hypothetical protein
LKGRGGSATLRALRTTLWIWEDVSRQARGGGGEGVVEKSLVELASLRAELGRKRRRLLERRKEVEDERRATMVVARMTMIWERGLSSFRITMERGRGNGGRREEVRLGVTHLYSF